MRQQLQRQPALEPEVVIGDSKYFTAEQISLAIGVPRYHIINLVRQGKLHGQRVGKVYLISADEFSEWVQSGNFEKQPYGTRHQQGERELVTA
jgi:excisionase family DNA binding protein